MGRPLPVIYFGPPGTGKTQTIARELEAAIARGLAPEEIALLSFSKQAVAQLSERAGVTAEMPYFRTIHSLAFKLCGLNRRQVVDDKKRAEFAALIGEPLPASMEFRYPTEAETDLSCALQLHEQARARRTTVAIEHARWHVTRLPLYRAERYVGCYEQWKQRQDFWDYADMLVRAEGTLPIKLLILDEAQDTTPAQWELIRRMLPPDCPTIFAGDDDQAIFNWAGADPEQLLRWKAERRVLDQSFRLPRAVKALADWISAGIHYRYPKVYAPRDAEGEIRKLAEEAQLNLTEGDWLLLARSGYQLQAYIEVARAQGVVYRVGHGKWSWDTPTVQAAHAFEALRRGDAIARVDYRRLMIWLPDPVPPHALPSAVRWEDAFADERFAGLRAHPWFEVLRMPVEEMAYIRALRRRGESLTQPGRVRISTIHRAKGAEAQHVALLLSMPQAAHEMMHWGDVRMADDERRVWYTGVTRAKETLSVVRRGRNQFPL